MARGARAAGRLAGPDVGAVRRAPHTAHRPCEAGRPAAGRPHRPASRGHRTWVRCARRRLSLPSAGSSRSRGSGDPPPGPQDTSGSAPPPEASALHGPLRGRCLRAARRTLTRRAALVRPPGPHAWSAPAARRPPDIPGLGLPRDPNYPRWPLYPSSVLCVVTVRTVRRCPGAGPEACPRAEAVAYATDPKRHLSPTPLTPNASCRLRH